MKRIGIIGGSGLYDLEGIKKIDEVNITTPFGMPSDFYTISQLNDIEVVFLPRHGRSHNINPTQINYRANIYGMKLLGVDKILSISACGSLKEEIKPLDFVIPTQFVDRTNQARKYTFFEDGIVAHVSFAYPICTALAKKLHESAQQCKVNVHYGGTYINMEGPQFSTLAESNLYRSWGMDVIGMTNIAEARLAREAEIAYVTLAAVTDYDCWHPSHESVTVEEIISNLTKNVANSKAVIREFIIKAAEVPNSAEDALKFAILTSKEHIPFSLKEKLSLLINKYIGQ
ncbi:MAG: S-methyl-5'-thioadenosine phosphorylase [Candidatus Omnitrophica bacterium]|nr:S-methyl-5'-thioadenosine phosphorylase [Candidatus Omnitrophota bacterium]